jgi:membrane protease subunit (stomatin/prohibitin family)
MAEIIENRWVATDSEFAVRVELSDISGFFSKRLRVDTGVRALVLENGQSIGEVSPGVYTLQSFGEKLAFWTRKLSTAILTRAEQVPIDLQCDGLPTAENLEVEVRVRLAVQIQDVALFVRNMLGGRNALSRDELRRLLTPVVRQALWEAVGRLSIRELTGEQARVDLENCIQQALQTSLTRNGLQITGVQTLSVAHPEYDEQRKRTGQLWLMRRDLEHQSAADQLARDRRLAEIEQQEQLDDLEILAKNVAVDRMSGELGAQLRRIGLRKEWREALQADAFDRMNTEDEMEVFLRERDTRKLLREDEWESLRETIRDKNLDRASKRAFLLEKLRIEQECELRGVRTELDHAQKLQSLEHEQELTQRLDTESRSRWQAELDRQRAEADRRRTEELQDLEHVRSRTRLAGGTRREEELAETLHVFEVKKTQQQMQVAQAETEHRIRLIQWEFDRMQADDRSAREQRAAEFRRLQNQWKIEDDAAAQANQDEADRRARALQLESVERLNASNMSFAEKQVQLQIAQKKAETDSRMAEIAAQTDGKVRTVEAYRGLSESEILATSDNAAIIADLRKKTSEHASSAEIAKAQAQAAANAAANAADQALRERLLVSQSEHNATLHDLLKHAQASHPTLIQQSASNMLELVRAMNAGHAAAPPPPSPTVVVVPGPGQQGAYAVPGTSSASAPVAPGPPTSRTLVCSGCRAEVSELAKFCPNCGKPT